MWEAKNTQNHDMKIKKIKDFLIRVYLLPLTAQAIKCW